MKRIHFCAGLEEWNGMAVVARLLAREQGAPLMDVADANSETISGADEIWVHSCWSPAVWRACRLALKARKTLVRMTHGNLDSVRLGYHGWRKHLAGPVERHCLRKASRIVATCEAEKGWIEAYLGKRCPPIEVTDIKRFFKFGFNNPQLITQNSQLHLLYLGRRHPLKGLQFLESASGECENVKVWKYGSVEIPNEDKWGIVFRVESGVLGEEKEKVWEWCDVLVLPTLSENFGLVIAEALERGKRVITTDGAPAWEDSLELRVRSLESGGEIWSGFDGRMIYLKGYRDGAGEARVRLLKAALEMLHPGAPAASM